LFFKKYEFNFTLIPTTAFIVAFICFIQLGFWQLERASEKNNINSNYTLRQDDTLINLNNTNSINNKEALLWRRAEVNGSFLNKKNIILDNQIFNQIAGFNILTPFLIKDSNYVVLINRGWHPNLASRDLIPDIQNLEGIKALKGHIAKFPSSGISLGQDNIETLNASVFRMQRLDFDKLKYFLTFNLLPYMIYIDPLIDKGNYNTFKLPAPDSEKNYGYAFQWFAFAFTLLIIFIKIGIRRKNGIKSKK
jgi:surfeit locus 1 family protein|tara:strand:- start:1836 stop:2585 length:750 start_codon:yes stop_codon:yes gene_type:complete